MSKHIVIIGNGISGVTAARHIRKKSNHKITIISSETEYFFSRTALMYIYMGHMQFDHTKPYEDWFWKKNRIELIKDYVTKINTYNKSIDFQSGGTLYYDILILATGSISNKFNWPGENLAGVQGLYSYPDLQLLEENSKEVKRAVIVGGGLIGIELAEMLLSRKIHVTFLVREKEFWSDVLPVQESRVITRHIRSHHIDLRLATELKEITGDKNDKVKSITTKNGETIDCQLVGLTVGVSPSINLVKNTDIKYNRGILVNEYLETTVSDIYAIGDCVERTYKLPGRRTIEQVWYTGRMMGEVVAQTICTKKTKYEPGPWFNSAKFFDIEYQTYGQVSNVLQNNESDFYWEDSSGKRCLHFVWESISGKFLGINAFGIRLRHEYFDRWLRESKSINHIINHLSDANFDPEFFQRFEKQIKTLFYQQAELTSLAT